MFQDLVVQNVTDRQKRKILEKGLVKRETFFFENYFKLMEFSYHSNLARYIKVKFVVYL